MASDWSTLEAQVFIPYKFQDVSLLRKALTAGDSNADDREGHRGMAQVGDALMSFVIMSEGFDRGMSRKEQQDATSALKSKELCTMLARTFRLDQMIKFSERQGRSGPQPTTLKNTLAALIGAVWLESRDYSAVLRVMAALGLVNDIETPFSSHDLTSTNTISWHLAGTKNSEGSGELDAETNVFNAFVDIDMLGPESMPGVSQPDPLSPWPAADLLHGRNMEPALVFPEMVGQIESMGCYGQLLPHGRDTLVAQYATTAACRVEQSAARTGNGELHSIPGQETACKAKEKPAALAYQECADASSLDIYGANDNIDLELSQTCVEQRPELVSPGVEDSGEADVPRKGSSLQRIFDAYIDQEAQKLQSQPELLVQHYNHIYSYQGALCAAETSEQRAMAKMVVAMGDCSAILLLKQAVENIRSPDTFDMFNVGQTMSPEQRFEAIRRLDLRMAHTKLVRWLHIHSLYEELSRNIGGKDADGFVVLTNVNLEQSPNEPRALAKRGNPRSLEQASITKRMVGHIDTNQSRRGRREPSNYSKKRLRRLGRRLQLLVHRWGLGVLALLGTYFTDELILTLRDDVFVRFIDIVDRIEGQCIRAVSAAATTAIQLFIDGNTCPKAMLLEFVGEDTILQLPRLSQDMQALFTFADCVEAF